MESISCRAVGLKDETIRKERSEAAGICQKHGHPVVIDTVTISGWSFSTTSGCLSCEQDAVDAERLQEEKRRDSAFRSAQRAAEVPPRYLSASFEPFPVVASGQDRIVADAKAFVESAGEGSTGLLLIGKIGTGKTHLACSILNALLRAGWKGLFLTTVQAIRRIKETWSKDSEQNERQVLRSLMAPDLLVLDEVGVQLGTDSEHLYLSEIINNRYNQMKPTILISNLTMLEFTALVGERVVDRFREGGKVLVFDWSSLRTGIRK